MASSIASFPQPVVADLEEVGTPLVWDECPDSDQDDTRGLKGIFTGVVFGAVVWCMILFLVGVIRL